MLSEHTVRDLFRAEACEPNESVVSLMPKMQIGPFGVDEQWDIAADLPSERLQVERAADIVENVVGLVQVGAHVRMGGRERDGLVSRGTVSAACARDSRAPLGISGISGLHFQVRLVSTTQKREFPENGPMDLAVVSNGGGWDHGWLQL